MCGGGGGGGGGGGEVQPITQGKSSQKEGSGSPLPPFQQCWALWPFCGGCPLIGKLKDKAIIISIQSSSNNCYPARACAAGVM